MNILEQEIEDLVWDAIESYDHEILAERGLPINIEFTYKRQFDLGSYGRADIIGFRVHPSRTNINTGRKERIVEVDIIELKKDKVNASTLFQAIRYAKAIQHKIKHENINYTFLFSIHLVGKSIDVDNDFIYLPDVVNGITLYTYELSITKGLVFKVAQGFHLSNPSFKADSKDITELLFDNVNNSVTNKREDMEFTRYYNEKNSPVTLDVAKDLPF
jgi:hypothetical protein